MVKLKPAPRPKETRGHRGSRFLPLGMVAGPAVNLLPMLLKYWKLVIFGALILFIFYQNYMTLEVLKPVGFRTIPGIIQDIDDDKQNLEIAQAQLQECELGNEKLKVAIETTNNQIDKWVKLSQQLQANQTELSTALVDLKKKSTTELEIILQGPIPQTCEGAVKLLRDAVTKGDLIWKSKS